MTARNFDKVSGPFEDVTESPDLAKAGRSEQEPKRLGVPRQSLLRMLIARHLELQQT